MRMPVVDIREMRMTMRHRRMLMRMCVWFCPIPWHVMRVLMMLVVNMVVGVIHGLVPVLMAMTFRQVQPHAQRHQRGGDPECERSGFVKKQDGHRRSNERRG